MEERVRRKIGGSGENEGKGRSEEKKAKRRSK